MSQQYEIIDANTTVGSHPNHKLDMSMERLIAEMDKHRITASLILSTTGVFYSYINGNSTVLEAAKSHNRLVPVATVNPKNYFGSASDLQAIRSQGFRIFKFYPEEQGWSVDSSAFAEVIKQLSAIKSPIMVNAAHAGVPSNVGRMTADYPAPVILCSISLETLSEALATAIRQPNVLIETHDLHVPGALELIAERVGAEKIIFGSGAPRLSIASSLEYVLKSELSDTDKQKVLGGNIRRVLEAA